MRNFFKKPLYGLFALAAGCVVLSCTSKQKPAAGILVDHDATDETLALFHSLDALRGEHTMFGHQATLAYGYHWEGDSARSDVNDVAGSFPALYGWDIRDFWWAQLSSEEETDQLFQQSLEWARQGIERGGVLTYAWHMSNPVTGESFYDTTSAVHAIIPGGEKHDEYKKTLDMVAEYFNELSPYPIIFRPFHEHNGDWFWWGKGLASEEDYISLWRFTVDYLRDTKGVHNLLYAFSPDRSRIDINSFKTEYFYAYPGDDYVDIIGLDNYWDVGHPANDASEELQQKQFIRSLTYTAQLADSLGKISALTETGLEAIPDPDFWTDKMLAALEANEWTKEITYVQVWRNANFEREQRDHYYAPFPGQVSDEDFLKFVGTDRILLEDELPEMY
jgi:mannan endo-1,4-beta-mannosidase